MHPRFQRAEHPDQAGRRDQRWRRARGIPSANPSKYCTVMRVVNKGIHPIEIPNRPARTWAQTIHSTIFFVVFIFGCIMVTASQFLFLLPLRFIPLPSARKLYGTGIRLTKDAFGTLLGKSQSPLSLAHL